MIALRASSSVPAAALGAALLLAGCGGDPWDRLPGGVDPDAEVSPGDDAVQADDDLDEKGDPLSESYLNNHDDDAGHDNQQDDPAPACDEDNFEDNDDAADAHPLTQGLHALGACDADWFTIDMEAGDRLSLELAWDAEEGDLAVELIDPLGSAAASPELYEGGALFEHTADVNGAWLVRVELAGDGGEVPGLRYLLELGVVEGECGDDGLEPNDSDLSPWPLGPGARTGLAVCPSGDDFWAFWLEPGDTLSVELLFDGAEGDLDLTLFDSSLALVAESHAGLDSETAGLTALASGWHVAWVELSQDSGTSPGTSYDLVVSVD